MGAILQAAISAATAAVMLAAAADVAGQQQVQQREQVQQRTQERAGKREIIPWNDRMNPKFTKQEIEDLVAYLNANFYKF